MEALYYTLAGILLYAASDWLLQRLEVRAGRRFEYRTLIFFCILSTLAISTFAVIRYFLQNH